MKSTNDLKSFDPESSHLTRDDFDVLAIQQSRNGGSQSREPVPHNGGIYRSSRRQYQPSFGQMAWGIEEMRRDHPELGISDKQIELLWRARTASDKGWTAPGELIGNLRFVYKQYQEGNYDRAARTLQEESVFEQLYRAHVQRREQNGCKPEPREVFFGKAG